jgi:cyclic-di-GMP-binding protein
MQSMSAPFHQIELPPSDIHILTFCGNSKQSSVKRWAESLKSTQYRQTAEALLSACNQIARLITTGAERKAMLDALFVVAYPTALNLGKDFLGQPFPLTDAAQESALLGQLLLKSLATAYAKSLHEQLTDKRLKLAALKPQLAQALCQGMQCLLLMQLRMLQLYSQGNSAIWRLANDFFRVARDLGISLQMCQFHYTPLGNQNLQNLYIKLVLLASGKCNQLTQVDMTQVADALEQWASAVRIETSGTRLLWLNLNDDKGPQTQESSESGDIIHFDFTRLIHQLTALLEGQNTLVDGPEIAIPAELTSPVVVHLANAWGQQLQRNQQRRLSHHKAEIVIGFSACHALLTQTPDLASFLGDTSSTAGGDLSRFLSIFQPDIPSTTPSSAAPILTTKTQNVSLQGYCLRIDDTQGLRIESGDILCIREHAKTDWNLGVIRWMRQYKSFTQIGVQLLGTHIIALAAAAPQRDGGYGDFMRAFWITGRDAQAASCLVTSHLVFSANTKIKLKYNQKDKPSLAKLGKRHLVTGKMAAFDVSNLDENRPSPSTTL